MIRFPLHPYFDADKGDGAGNAAESDTTTADAKPGEQGDTAEVTFTAAQQAAINKLIGDARKDGRKAAETDAEKKRREADETRERDDQVKRGEFDAVRTGFETKLTTTAEERDAIAKKFERANAAMTSVLADRIKALNDLNNKDLTDAFPKDAEPLDQLDWLNDPRTKAAMTTAEESKRVETARTNGRVPATLRPSGFTQDDAQEAEMVRLARSGKYGI